MRKTLPLAILCAPTLGFTECEYFSTVTVPATDTVHPSMFSRIYANDTEIIESDPSVLVDSLDEDFAVYPVIFDSGGVWDLEVRETVTFACITATGQPNFQQRELTPQRASVPFGLPIPVGTQVSNGQFLVGQVSSLADWAFLCPGQFVDYAVYSWEYDGFDGKGNFSSAEGMVSYFSFL